ncbi:FliH/SctL family protein [Thiomicrorhabdus sp. zzn3]|uniref:FliH/SctL family protein n=1 Tax=Thiomicrorhabdus sp. zzn3 TaxID=3039775 RepID=UPI0024363C6F|nr:FliH/SctL family protein [Thiomicrorhabdus sp. zzn3]MDG6777634.1 FliH/SctL family protein [Thiomicrorhabdus sp. zzn3]
MDEAQSTKAPSLDEEEIELATVIPAEQVAAPEIRPWTLNNLEEEERFKALETEQKVYEEIQERLKPEIQRQTEVLKKETYELAKREGFDAGYEEGKKLGQQEAKEIALAEAEKQLANELERMDGVISSLNAPYRLLENKVYESLTHLALQVAEEVIQQEIKGRSDWVFKIIHEAVNTLNDSLAPIDVFLHPNDLKLIESHSDDVAKNWRLHADEAVSEGTCRVKQDFSSIDHNWKNRFQTMAVKLQAQAVAEDQQRSQAHVDVHD